nr:hypothetical protein CFP56_75362 [Quercus suber]
MVQLWSPSKRRVEQSSFDDPELTVYDRRIYVVTAVIGGTRGAVGGIGRLFEIFCCVLTLEENQLRLQSNAGTKMRSRTIRWKLKVIVVVERYSAQNLDSVGREAVHLLVVSTSLKSFGSLVASHVSASKSSS